MSCRMNMNLPLALASPEAHERTRQYQHWISNTRAQALVEWTNAYIGNMKKNTEAKKMLMLLNFDVSM